MNKSFILDIFCPLFACITLSIMLYYSISNEGYFKISLSTKGQSMTSQSINTQIFATQPLVYGYMLKLTKNPNTAYDAAMDGILKAIDNADKYDGSSKVSTWVCTVAYRLWLDSVRSHANSRTTYTGDSVFMENIGGSYTHDFDRTDVSGVWDVAKGILNDKQYACLNLHSQGLKYKEIANRLSIPIGSVMSAISGAKKKLRDNPVFKSLFSDMA